MKSGAEVEFVKSASKLADLPKDGLPEVAFVGPSNVGKSTLVNALLGRKNIAKVSKTPGRTQLLNYFRVDRRLYFVDLPGYGFARVPQAVQQKFRELTEAYLARSPHLRLLLLLQDARRLPSANDREILTWAVESDVPRVIVLTKADKLSRGALDRQRRAVADRLADVTEDVPALIPFSAKNGQGRRELWREIDAIRVGAEAR